VSFFVVVKVAEFQTRGRISRWLQARNVSLYLGYISWTTTRFNQILMRTGQRHRKVLDVWFSLGVTFGLIGLVGSVLLLLGNLAIIVNLTLGDMRYDLAQHSAAAGIPLTHAHPETRLPESAKPQIPLPEPHPAQVSTTHRSRRLMSLPGDVADASHPHTLHETMFKPGRWQTFSSTEETVLQQVRAAEKVAEHAAVAYGEAIKVNTGYITPLLPGVNLPKSQIWYVLIALFLSAVVHELGHALAAGAEELRVNGVAGFLALVFPGAYVQIRGVEMLPPWRQLKVYCAGAWHNIAVALVCVVGVLSLPVALWPFFSLAQAGAVVVSVPETSSLYGYVRPGDVLVATGPHLITSRKDFFHGLGSAKVSNQSLGFCMTSDFVAKNSVKGTECCEPQTEESEIRREKDELQCFEHYGTNSRHCLSSRSVATMNTCHSSDECRETVPSLSGTEQSGCFAVVVPEGERLIDVHIVEGGSGKDRHFLFQGLPEVLGHSILLSDYTPRFTALYGYSPLLYRFIVSIDAPRKMDRLFKYTFSVSVALAILNMTPVFFLDGEASAILFVRLLHPDLSPVFEEKLKKALLVSGTSLLVANIVFSLVLMEA